VIVYYIYGPFIDRLVKTCVPILPQFTTLRSVGVCSNYKIYLKRVFDNDVLLSDINDITSMLLLFVYAVNVQLKTNKRK